MTQNYKFAFITAKVVVGNVLINSGIILILYLLII